MGVISRKSKGDIIETRMGRRNISLVGLVECEALFLGLWTVMALEIKKLKVGNSNLMINATRNAWRSALLK